MSDGIQLFSRIYLPSSIPPGGLPTVLRRTPYAFPDSEQFYDDQGAFFSGQGFVYIAQDIRGRGRSSGKFETGNVLIEKQDGFDTCEWIVKQTWSNGKIGTFGGSYSGYTSVVTAIDNPHVKVVVSDDPWVDYREDFLHPGHVPTSSQLDWLYYLDHGEWVPPDLIPTLCERLDPYAIDQDLLGRTDPDWQAYVDLYGDFFSPYWDSHSLVPFYDRICAPVLLAVKYPALHLSAMAMWEGIRELGCDEHRDDVRFIFTTEEHCFHSGRLGYQMTYVNQLMLDYLNKYLKDSLISFSDLGTVIYKAPDEEDYRHGDIWPISNHEMVWYLTNQVDQLREGKLSSDTRATGQLNWEIMPETMSAFRKEYPELIFLSEPFSHDVYLGGKARIDLWISASSPDLDFFVYLYERSGPREEDVRLINRAANRVKYRHGTGGEELLADENPINLEMETYDFVYNVKAGNRLELRLVNARPWCLENPLTGEPFQAQTHWSTARVSLYLNSQYPSKIVLPAVSHEKKGTIRRLP
ncbi:MAG: CocE/NonD family hydrolase [Candidatus Aminicenantes bacterium]|nr:MAG: CocE/NonD family hydrolase [Candidatus Aminicenantes bacterium]